LEKPKAGAKHDHLFNKPASVEHPSWNYVAQQSVTKIITMTILNLATPKAGAKHEFLFNKPASGRFNELQGLT
jgi:hypothetical protein